MPKNPNTPNKNKYFIYKTQSPKKTHCHKTINNYNYQQTSEFLSIRPIYHWTGDKDNNKWEYYKFLTTQLTLSLNEFQKTGEWYHWNQFQKNNHLLKQLVHNSVNLTYFTPEEANSLNESATGKKAQTNDQ